MSAARSGLVGSALADDLGPETYDEVEELLSWKRRVDACIANIKTLVDPIDMAFYTPFVVKNQRVSFQRMRTSVGLSLIFGTTDLEFCRSLVWVSDAIVPSRVCGISSSTTRDDLFFGGWVYSVFFASYFQLRPDFWSGCYGGAEQARRRSLSQNQAFGLRGQRQKRNLGQIFFYSRVSVLLKKSFALGALRSRFSNLFVLVLRDDQIWSLLLVGRCREAQNVV